MTNLKQITDEKTDIAIAYDMYTKHVETNNLKPVHQSTFGKVLKKVYPNVSVQRRAMSDISNKNVYIGLGINRDTDQQELDILSISKFLKEKDYQTVGTACRLQAQRCLSMKINKIPIKIEIFYDVGKLIVQVQGKEIRMKDYGFPQTFLLTKENFNALDTLLSTVNVCKGKSVVPQVRAVPSITINEWEEDTKITRVVKSKKCEWLLPLTSTGDCCRRCQTAFKHACELLPPAFLVCIYLYSPFHDKLWAVQ